MPINRNPVIGSLCRIKYYPFFLSSSATLPITVHLSVTMTPPQTQPTPRHSTTWQARGWPRFRRDLTGGSSAGYRRGPPVARRLGRARHLHYRPCATRSVRSDRCQHVRATSKGELGVGSCGQAGVMGRDGLYKVTGRSGQAKG